MDMKILKNRKKERKKYYKYNNSEKMLDNKYSNI